MVGSAVTWSDAKAPLERATVALDSSARGALATWIELLCTWNARIDLTAARTGGEMVDLMLADALVLAARIPRGVRVVDVGSGAGAPGLAIALARPDLAMTLCEPLVKRASFLRTVVGTVGRADIAIERGRGEDLRGPWDVALSRATLAPPAWLAMGAKLAPATWVLLAKDEPPVLDGLTASDDVTYEWPETNATRRAICYSRSPARPE
jgi:16S rRNA (guanine527-N7)-methyltransferase